MLPCDEAPVRLEINISAEESEILQRFAKNEGISITHLVRKMISVYDFLDREVTQGNKVLQIVDQEKREITTLALI